MIYAGIISDCQTYPSPTVTLLAASDTCTALQMLFQYRLLLPF